MGRVLLFNGRRDAPDQSVITYDSAIACTDRLSLNPFKEIRGCFNHRLLLHEKPRANGPYISGRTPRIQRRSKTERVETRLSRPELQFYKIFAFADAHEAKTVQLLSVM